MMTTHFTRLFLAGFLTMAGASNARAQQPGPPGPNLKRILDLENNRMKLDVSVRMDRDVYFPGEDAQVTVRVVNPTAQILEVPEPFDERTGNVSIMARGTGDLKNDWVVVSGGGGHGPVIAVPDANLPVQPAVWISPNQPLETTFWLSAAGCHGHAVPFVKVCQLEEREGEYRLGYGYTAKAFATFRVVWPQLEQWAESVLAKPYQYEEVLPNKVKTGNIRTLQRRVRAMVLAYQGTNFIAVSNEAVTSGAHVWQDPSGKLVAAMNRQFGIYRRISTSAIPITTLQITAGNAENITINYTDQDGRHFTLNLDANHQLISHP